jgi:23S rRNA-/tRNA-specific pseudouridylate synthase
LAAIGAPVLNDPIYGDAEIKLLLSELKRRYKGREREQPLVRRLALHASELRFLHPRTRESVTVAAPLPAEFEVALKYLRKYPPAPARPSAFRTDSG